MKKWKWHKMDFRNRLMAYLDGKMASRDRHVFERDAMQHPLEEDALEGFEGLSTEDINADLNFLSERLQKQTRKTIPYLYFKIAASVLVLLAVGWLLYHKPTDNFSDGKMITEQPMQQYEPEAEIIKPMPNEAEQDLSEADEPARKEILPKPKHQEKERVALEIHSDVIIEPEEHLSAEEPAAGAEAGSPAASENQLKPVAPIRKEIEGFKNEEYVYKQKQGHAGFKNLKGFVYDEAGQPLIGANITLPGTDIGTISDASGRFELKVPENQPSESIAVNFIGYVEEKLAVEKNDGEIEVYLVPDILALDEVVVIGYGTQKKSDVTGSISTIEMDQNQKPANSAYPKDGFLALRKYIKENIYLPTDAGQIKKPKVRLEFTVMPDSTLQNFEVLETPEESFSKIAIDILKKGPKWVPSPEPDKNRVRYTVRFE